MPIARHYLHLQAFVFSFHNTHHAYLHTSHAHSFLTIPSPPLDAHSRPHMAAHNPDISRSVDQRTEGRLRHAQEATAAAAAAATTLQSAAIFQYHSNGDDCGAQVLAGAVDDGVAEVMKGKLEISLSDLWTKKP